MAFRAGLHGDVFPCPCPCEVDGVPRKDLSRKVRQRIFRRIRRQQDQRECVASLNESVTGSAAFSSFAPSAAQRSLLSNVDQACSGTYCDEVPFLPKAALEALLGTDSLYFSGSVGQLAPYVDNNVSIPSEQTEGCNIDTVLKGMF